MSNTTARGNASSAGTPAGWVEPELATLTHDRFSDPDWLYERKFDGERCLAYTARRPGQPADPQPPAGGQHLPGTRRGARGPGDT